MGGKDKLINGQGVAALRWYFVCLVLTGAAPKVAWILRLSDNLRNFMAESLTPIGASLATFVDAQIGLSRVALAAPRPKPDFTESRLLRALDACRFMADLRWTAAAVYLFSIVVALLFWFVTGADADPAIVDLGKSLIGFMVANLGIMLAVPHGLRALRFNRRGVLVLV